MHMMSLCQGLGVAHVDPARQSEFVYGYETLMVYDLASDDHINAAMRVQRSPCCPLLIYIRTAAVRAAAYLVP